MAAAARDLDLYQAMGGAETCRKLSAAFYARVDRDPQLRPIFPAKNLHCAVAEFAAFLVQFLGGPGEDAQRRWWLSLRESHLRFRIGPEERAAWMKNMVLALDDVELEESLRVALRRFFEESSAYLINQGKADEPGGELVPEIARRWNAQRALDETVAAVRAGDADRAIALAGSFQRDPAVQASLLALMSGSSNEVLADYVRQELLRSPALVRQSYVSGRTLLHDAAGRGNLALVELLLGLGADSNAADAGGHAPLYCVANQCGRAGGGDVVRALVRAGANVDARGGVKHCTALHMAARRGNVEIAGALLDAGADSEARDSAGVTPLRRAMNCRRPAVAALLRDRQLA